MLFRRRLLSDVWHWRPDCRWWPQLPLTFKEREQPSRPSSGEACDTCLAKDRHDRREP